MKKPCPQCSSKNVHHRDCGYSSFNPHWVECDDCGFRVNGGFLAWNKTAMALNGKKMISKKKQRWANALARMMSEGELKEIVCGDNETRYR